MNPILVLSFGYDGCLQNQANSQSIVNNNSEFIRLLKLRINQLKIELPKKSKCVVLINSRRQSSTLVNGQSNSEPFQEYEELSQELGAEIDPFLMGKIFNPHYNMMFETIKTQRLHAPPAGWIVDDSKLSIIYAQIHKMALDHLGLSVTLQFYDGCNKRLTDLHDFFSKNPQLIPESVTLELIFYDKANLEEISSIQGEGKFINVNYSSMILEVSEKALIEKRDGGVAIEKARSNSYRNLSSISLVFDAQDTFVADHNRYHPDALYRKEIIKEAIALYKRRLMDDSFARNKQIKIAGVDNFMMSINLSISIADIEKNVHEFLNDDNTKYLAKFKYILSKRWEKAAILAFNPPRPLALVELGSTPDAGETIAATLKEKGIVDAYLFIFANFDNTLADQLRDHISVFTKYGIQVHRVGSFEDLVKPLRRISDRSKLHESLKLIERGGTDLSQFNNNLLKTKVLLEKAKSEQRDWETEFGNKLTDLMIFEKYYQNLSVSQSCLGSFINFYCKIEKPEPNFLFEQLDITRMGLRYKTQLNPEKMLMELFFNAQPTWVTKVVAYGECASLMAQINQAQGNMRIPLSPNNDVSYYNVRLFKLQLKSPIFKIDAGLYQEIAGKIDAYISKLKRKDYNIFQHNTLSKIKALEDLKQMLAVPLQSDRVVRDILIRWGNTVLYQDKLKKEPASMSAIISDTRKKHIVATRSPQMEAPTKTQIFIDKLRTDYGQRCLTSDRYVPAVLSPKVF